MEDKTMNYSYEEVTDVIQNTRRFGNYTGYEVSKQMLEQLGNPQSGIPFVHIAGTNGKGSTTAFLCKILEQTGKKIGMFTSPHLIDFEERIRINGQCIPREDVTRIGNRLLEMNFKLPPTMFDYCLAMAVLYFKEQECDLMVMETGIGGRYDSTNALGKPKAAVITKIGLDHMAVLGNTIEEIAGEKAGIIKPGVPVVVQRQEVSVRNVLWNYFSRINSANTEDEIQPEFYEVSKEDLQYAASLPKKMLGDFQVENAAAAILAFRVLYSREEKEKTDKEEIEKTEQYIRDGIAQTFWKGRMELVNENPFFLIDGAHNSHGVHALAESLESLYPEERFHFIMGVMADKDYENMIEELLPLAIDFVTVTPDCSRALQSKELASCIEAKGVRAVYAEDMASVIQPLLPVKAQNTENSSETGEKTVAFGSLYFIGAIEALLEKGNINNS